MFELVITIENVVLTGSFSEEVDLKVANQKLVGSRCNWQRFPGLSFKLKSTSATFLLFRTGKFVCTGTKTKIKAEQATTAFLNLLKKEGLVSDQCWFECCVKNIVASVDLAGATVSVEQITGEFNAVYEPDKFPAAVCKTEEPKATFLVFLAGKMVCSGIADEETLKKTVQKFYQDLVEKKVIEQSLS
ncbi:MAG: TATA-box-binding protein [Nitrososphaerota archaeon]|nr:TATA-box-binding protein [Nitrososphaerota archaeon]